MSTRYSFSSDEINEAINILECAVINHRKWYESLLEGLVCNQPFNEQITDPLSHTKCGFGCWYYQSVSEAIRATPEFSVIESTHKEMHDAARDLVLQYQQNQAVSLAGFRTLGSRKAQLDQLLNRMRDTIVSQQNSFDALTGLINRRSIGLILDKNHAASVRHNTPYILAMLDIDFFKAINDTYGHEAGDLALVFFATILKHGVKSEDLIIRLGGDEFVLVLTNTDISGVIAIKRRLAEALNEKRANLGVVNLHLEASVGYATYPADATTTDALLLQADKAMYHEKRARKAAKVACDQPSVLPT